MFRGEQVNKQLEGLENLEVSLLGLLTKEDELVDQYNSSVRAYALAKKNSMRTNEYKNEMVKIKDKLDDVRIDIKTHLNSNYSLKTDLASELYQ